MYVFHFYEDGPKFGHRTHNFVYRRASNLYFLYNVIKYIVEGHNLAELCTQMHAQVIDTGLFSCALCFFTVIFCCRQSSKLHYRQQKV